MINESTYRLATSKEKNALERTALTVGLLVQLVLKDQPRSCFRLDCLFVSVDAQLFQENKQTRSTRVDPFYVEEILIFVNLNELKATQI